MNADRKGVIRAQDKFATSNKLTHKYSIKLLCELADVSRSGYYKWLNKSKKQIDMDICNKILEIYNTSKLVYGYRRVKVALRRKYNMIVNHKKVRRLMRLLGIQSIIRKKKFKYSTPKNLIQDKSEDNILNRDFSTTGMYQKWVTDITYLYYGKSHNRAYLSAIMDLHNNEIISYKLSISLGIEFVRDTLIEAFSGKKANDLRKLIIHSDQGVHYRSLIYKNLIKENKITQSMSRKGNCYDNACIENFFGHIKSELIYQNHFNTREELFKAVSEYIYWYNNERFQTVLKNRTPIEARSAA
ncbi:IS3 family transposase [Clostridium botulinum]|uniref:IS3 family transposase n=1 Tax=Clostridium botulinum TaxID=1491 RepID=A0A6G4D647_CLOBO|nr:IS3 family transposase [Clostridium botulinum]